MTVRLLEAARRPQPQRELEAEMRRVWAELDRMDDRAARMVLDHVTTMRAGILDRLAALQTVTIDNAETFEATALRAFAADLDEVAARFAQRYGIDLGSEMRAAATFSDEAHRAALTQLARSTGVPPALISMSTLGIADDQVAAAVLFNTQAIKGVSQRMAAGVHAELQAVIFGGRSRWDAVRNIRDLLAGEPGWLKRPPKGKAIGKLTQQAITIERTSTLAAFNIAADHAYRQAIEELPDLSVEWMATQGPRTCQLCKSLNGKRKHPRGTFPGNIVAPPRHSRCRCRVVAWMPGWG